MSELQKTLEKLEQLHAKNKGGTASQSYNEGYEASFKVKAYDLYRQLALDAMKLITAQRDLIDFYSNYIGRLNEFLHTHRMAPTEYEVKRGEELRRAVEEAEK